MVSGTGEFDLCRVVIKVYGYLSTGYFIVFFSFFNFQLKNIFSIVNFLLLMVKIFLFLCLYLFNVGGCFF